MIKIENTQVVGWEPAIRGMRNPMNSWEKSDSLFFDSPEYDDARYKEFELDDFSYDHLLFMDKLFEEPEAGIDIPLIGINIQNEGSLIQDPLDILKDTIDMLNQARKMFLETKDKRYWWQMIQLLPASFNQKRTVMMNYEVLAGIYPKRKNHKLDEWHGFCDWIKGLPYNEIITLESDGA